MHWRHLGRSSLIVVLLTALAGAALAPTSRGLAQEATPAADSLLAQFGYPTLTLTTDGTTATIPAEIEAGRYHLLLQNDGTLLIEVDLVHVPAERTAAAVQTAIEEAITTDEFPPLLYEVVINGSVAAPPGATGEVVLDLTAGAWVFSFFGFDEATGEVTMLFEVLTVTGDLPPLEDPDVAAEIHLVDFDFVIPDGLIAGPQVWKLHSSGQPHHLILGQIPVGTTEEQVLELLTALFAPPATPEAEATPVEPALSFEDYVEVGFSGILSSGQANWLAFDLAPGTYVALCFVPTPDGVPHVMLGMIELFTVE